MSDYDVYEAAVLSLTLRADYAAQVFDAIKPADFGPQLRGYAEAAYELVQDGTPVDLLTTAERMEANGEQDALAKISDIVEYAGKPSIENLAEYCRILNSRGLKRSLFSALMDVKQILADEPDANAAHQKIIAVFESVQAGQQDDQFLWDMPRANREFLEEMQRRNDAGGELIGLSTGYKNLDDKLNGMRGGDLIIVAGRPSMGKTTFALNMVEHNVTRAKVPSLVFSMEMPASQVIEKMTASIGGITLNSLRRGTLTEEEWAKFTAASKVIQNATLHIDDRGGLSIPQMRARAHEVKRRAGDLGLIMVDYLQLMNAKAENRTGEITKITGGLKALAKEFRCPVIALSQLSRAVENRADKRPQMSDLRESGSIEQDADVIIFPFREGYYDNPDDPDPLTEIIFGKVRMGERGSEGLEFQGHHSRFKALDHRVDFSARRAAKAADQVPPRYAKKARGMDL